MQLVTTPLQGQFLALPPSVHTDRAPSPWRRTIFVADDAPIELATRIDPAAKVERFRAGALPYPVFLRSDADIRMQKGVPQLVSLIVAPDMRPNTYAMRLELDEDGLSSPWLHAFVLTLLSIRDRVSDDWERLLANLPRSAAAQYAMRHGYPLTIG